MAGVPAGARSAPGSAPGRARHFAAQALFLDPLGSVLVSPEDGEPPLLLGGHLVRDLDLDLHDSAAWC